MRLLRPALSSARTVNTVHCSCTVCRRPLALRAVAPLGAPDSPVNYSGAASRIPEVEQFGVELPGAPDTIRWHTGQSGAPDHGNLQVVFCSPYLNPFLGLFISLL